MTAKTSAKTSRGTTSPVDSLAPNARAMKVTLITAMPFIPALERPITNAAALASIHDVREISIVVNMSTLGVGRTKGKSILNYFIFDR